MAASRVIDDFAASANKIRSTVPYGGMSSREGPGTCRADQMPPSADRLSGLGFAPKRSSRQGNDILAELWRAPCVRSRRSRTPRLFFITARRVLCNAWRSHEIWVMRSSFHDHIWRLKSSSGSAPCLLTQKRRAPILTTRPRQAQRAGPGRGPSRIRPRPAIGIFTLWPAAGIQDSGPNVVPHREGRHTRSRRWRWHRRPSGSARGRDAQPVHCGSP